jgi:hypothetical protein
MNDVAPAPATAPANTSSSPLAPKFQTNPGAPFFMTSADWQKVQCYLVAGIQLPISGEEARIKLKINAEDVQHFSDLWNTYKSVHDHCATFNSVTYPETVAVAGDIVDYGRHKAPIFYGAIQKILDAIDAGTMNEEKGEAQITIALKNLSDDATKRAKKAAAAAASIQKFIQQTQEDQGVMTPLKTRFLQELEGVGGRITQLEQEITDDRALIESYNDEYRKDVTIACTTATYAWLFPAGTIAAAVVAGVYGDKAVQALKRVHEFQDKLEKDNAELASKLLMSADLKSCDASLKGIIDSLTVALPILGKARGAWEALSTDINKVLDTINNDIKDAPTFIQSLGVNEAIAQWADIATKADNYRANAFVSIVPLAEIQTKLANDPRAYDVPKAA